MIDLEQIANQITDGYKKAEETAFKRDFVLPQFGEIKALLIELRKLLFPEYYAMDKAGKEENEFAKELLESIYARLKKQVEFSLSFCHKRSARKEAERITDEFILKIPEIQSALLTDLQATFEGDPAAKCKEEIVFSYPGFYAVFVYRIAHILYEYEVPFLPRMMSEYAHSKTGIDINPGAKIGPYFCIDHGTGIVIGETAVLGEHVKLYQGVTIGAKSFEKDENGNLVKGGKRHPDIGNHVVIYANATILGGTTRIGDHCTVGGNVWLVDSLAEGSTIIHDREDRIIRK